jgi:hypothetical protein
MRVKLDPREFRKARKRPLPVVHAALDLSVARPEKVFASLLGNIHTEKVRKNLKREISHVL